MNYVDRKIEEVVQMTEYVFKDNATAYIFTADHGMTDWGSHGSGSTDETETPLIVWGAGINNLNSRQDIEQIDITPLISTLIGAPIPVNNEVCITLNPLKVLRCKSFLYSCILFFQGVLPWQYLNTSNLGYTNDALLNNLKQLTHQVKANREMNCENNKFSDWRVNQLESKIFTLENHYQIKDSKERFKETVEAIKLAKDSLLYFRQYQRSWLLIYLSTMWLGWIVLLFFKIAGTERPVINRFALLITDIALVCILITVFITLKGTTSLNIHNYSKHLRIVTRIQ